MRQLSAAPLRILVTGFDGFPGSPNNPTARMIARLARRRPRFLRAGISLRLAVLPVIYAGIGPRLDALMRAHRPDAVLHFGVAPRRQRISVESRARNRLSLLHPDAGGAMAPAREIVAGAPLLVKSTLPCGRIAAALRRRGFEAAVSIDAGDYVCNQTLFLSLSRRHAPVVGFIHVPPQKRLGLEAATEAAATAILALAPGLRARRTAAGS